jgi:hypothetical protein
MDLRLIARVFAYLPAALFVILAALSSYFPHLLDGFSQQYVLALLGLALISVGFRLESRYMEEAMRIERLDATIERLAGVQAQFLERVSRPISPSSLAAGFRQQAAAGRRVGKLRIFAISSQQILSFFRSEDFLVDTCQLLVRAFDRNDAAHAEFQNQILLAVKDWKRLAVDGKIKTLSIRSYDFFPTEYQVIFDDKAMLSGLYDSAPSDYSEVLVRHPFHVDGFSADGRSMIHAYSHRFDNLFEQCGTHHGANRYDEYCHP